VNSLSYRCQIELFTKRARRLRCRYATTQANRTDSSFISNTFLSAVATPERYPPSRAATTDEQNVHPSLAPDTDVNSIWVHSVGISHDRVLSQHRVPRSAAAENAACAARTVHAVGSHGIDQEPENQLPRLGLPTR
jgi:hypothetical protein